MHLILPSKCRIAGLGMITIGILGIGLATTNGLINVYRIIDPSKTLADGSYPYPNGFWQLNQLIGYSSVSLAILGLLFFFFAREQDEFLYRVRLESLQFATLAQLGIIFCLSLCFFFTRTVLIASLIPTILTLSVVSFWLFYVIRYSYIVYFKSRPKSEI